MLSVVDAHQAGQNINSIYKLRHDVFKGRLDWQVNSIDGLEYDEFDHENTRYLARFDHLGRAVSCCRIMPTEGPNMLRDVFPHLLAGNFPASPAIWEISRFAVDTNATKSDGFIGNLTVELLIGLVEFAIENDLSGYVGVVDVRMERIINRSGWGVFRLGIPQQIGKTKALAIFAPTNRAVLTQIMKKNHYTLS